MEGSNFAMLLKRMKNCKVTAFFLAISIFLACGCSNKESNDELQRRSYLASEIEAEMKNEESAIDSFYKEIESRESEYESISSEFDDYKNLHPRQPQQDSGSESVLEDLVSYLEEAGFEFSGPYNNEGTLGYIALNDSLLIMFSEYADTEDLDSLFSKSCEEYKKFSSDSSFDGEVTIEDNLIILNGTFKGNADYSDGDYYIVLLADENILISVTADNNEASTVTEVNQIFTELGYSL